MAANYLAGLVSLKLVSTVSIHLLVRFTNRDKRNEIFLNWLNNNAVGPNARKSTTNLISSNFIVRENLTSLR